LGADLLEVGGSYASLVEAVSHRLEPREPLVVPLRVSGHKASFGGSRFDPARALRLRTPDPGTPPREPGARAPPGDLATKQSGVQLTNISAGVEGQVERRRKPLSHAENLRLRTRCRPRGPP